MPMNSGQPDNNTGMGNTGMMNATATPGSMIPDSPGAAHMMEPITGINVQPATETIGGQPLAYTDDNGVNVFELTARMVQWTLTEGNQVRIIVKNELAEPITIHWHGVEVPNSMDGVPGVTQDPIQPGETFTYEFTAKPAGTFMYHSHYEGDRQVSAGLYAPFIIDPKTPEANPPDVDVTLMLSEWLMRDGVTYAAMPMGGMEPNYFTINGKSFPSTQTINVKVGQRVRMRFIGIGQFIHPMHLHGVPFKIVATDGHLIPDAAQLTKDTISVAPGERYDVEFVATEPGQWMLHCHILHHTTNDNVEPGGSAAPEPAPVSTEPSITLQTNPAPAMMGDLELVLTVKDAVGNPLTGATVMVTADHTDMTGMSMTGQAIEQGEGRYAIQANFSMSGNWRLTVEVRKDSQVFTQELPLEIK
ncbi:MAG: FixH family protein [Chloroflexota bacterium]